MCKRNPKLLILCLSLLSGLSAFAAPGHIVLFNGTSSAGKSSLAEVALEEAEANFEVVSYDHFYHAYRDQHRITAWKPGQYQDFLHSLYRHAKEQANSGKNIIIDTVEFDRDPERYCAVLDCSKVTKVIVYCPLQDLLKRIEKRNSSGIPRNRRAVLLAFQQFVEMYQPQSAREELVVDRTTTSVMRAALKEADSKANNARQFDALYQKYVAAFGIDKDKEVVIVPKGKYDLVINTRAQTKKENVRRLEAFIRSRPRPN